MEAELGTERGMPDRTPEDGAQALAEFAALHGPALRASGVPERYWGRLLYKLEHEVRTGPWAGEPGCRRPLERHGERVRTARDGPRWTPLREGRGRASTCRQGAGSSSPHEWRAARGGSMDKLETR
jgi:hypothetical protein